MSLKDIFADTDGQQERVREYYATRNAQLERAFKKIAAGLPVRFDLDQAFVRIFMDADIDVPQELKFLEISRLTKNLNSILEGGVYIGHPKFGEYEIISGGRGQTTKGTTGIYLDLFPQERFEYQDDSKPVMDARAICDSILHDKRLIAQFETWGVREVQTSTGLFVSLEEPRPVAPLPSTKPAAPAPAP